MRKKENLLHIQPTVVTKELRRTLRAIYYNHYSQFLTFKPTNKGRITVLLLYWKITPAGGQYWQAICRAYSLTAKTLGGTTSND